MLGLSENNTALLITCLTVIIVVAITHGKGIKVKSENNELAITSEKDEDSLDFNKKKHKKKK